MDVIDLNQRRRDSEQPKPDYVTCECGEAWFELRGNHPKMPEHGAVVLRPDGTISGYAGTPCCVGCGKAAVLRPTAT
ncbi:hypothetical protein PV377_02910 [Streptomyces ipomoeae]|uniref:hypothetical protein n=1 Tax=Streptomyces ipomoeae TaxID=103232 RepID=UPI0029BE1FE2|nr:hypothetical protein [Streptomyces ipomoeae]MDX2837962.1 hypothetical protein [Streptomyces ipomoeae]